MASEDTLEELPGDQSIDSLVPTEQSDAESSVGNCGQKRPQHCDFYSLFLWQSSLSASSFTSCKKASAL